MDRNNINNNVTLVRQPKTHYASQILLRWGEVFFLLLSMWSQFSNLSAYTATNLLWSTFEASRQQRKERLNIGHTSSLSHELTSFASYNTGPRCLGIGGGLSGFVFFF